MFATAAVAWITCGVLGEALLNASERVEFAQLYQSPLWPASKLAFAMHGFGGPLALAADATAVFSITGYHGLNFNTAPKPCVETSEFNRALWCHDQLEKRP